MIVLLAAAASRSLPAVASRAIGFAESRPSAHSPGFGAYQGRSAGSSPRWWRRLIALRGSLPVRTIFRLPLASVTRGVQQAAGHRQGAVFHWGNGDREAEADRTSASGNTRRRLSG